MTAIIKPPIQAGGNLIKTGSTISDGPGLATDVEITAAVAAHAAGSHASNPPTGGAGGVLSGTYPSPGFAVDMAVQSELDDVADALALEVIARAADVDAEEAARIAADGLKADDADVVKLTGNQTIAGTKTFSSAPTVPDASFSAAKLSFDVATQVELDAEATARANADTTLQTNIDGKQAGDADLTAIAGLIPSNDDVIQRKAGAWTNRSPAQVKTDLALVKGDVGLGNVDNLQQIPLTQKAAASGVASLDAGSRVVQVPKLHASAHQSGGDDVIKLDDLATPDDNTDLNASSTRHGLLPKLSNIANELLSGLGTWVKQKVIGTGTNTLTALDNGPNVELLLTGGAGGIVFASGIIYPPGWSTSGLALNANGFIDIDDGEIVLNRDQFGIREGTNKRLGVATLVGGAVVVSTTRVTANARIMLAVQSLGTVLLPKALAVTARTVGVSFTITSADPTDTSVVAWFIIQPI